MDDFSKEVERRKSFYLNNEKAIEFEKYKDKYSMIANRINLIINDSLSRINYKYTPEDRQKVYAYIESLLFQFIEMYCNDFGIDLEVSETGQVKIGNAFVYDRLWIDVFELYEFLERLRLLIETNEIESEIHR